MTDRRRARVLRRALTAAVLAVAIALVAIAMFDPFAPGSYKVRAEFQNAGQVVKGGLVEIAGRRIGTITDLRLTGNGSAEVELSIDEEWAPLPRGTRAQIRQFGLSGPASRYVELKYPARRDKGDIEDGGSIGLDQTTSVVELDQVFSIFDPPTRKSLRNAFRGSARQYAGQAKNAREGWLYLDPALVSASRLFQELNRDTPNLERFLDETSSLVGDIAERRDDLSSLVSNLADTTGAISRPRGALADAIHQLPGFMRQANTTYVNLRAALDDLDPLVDDAKPVAKQLVPYTRELRGLTTNLEPTVKDLARLAGRRGPDNDLIDLARRFPPLRDIAIGPVEVNGEEVPGALPAATRALDSATPRVAHFRPYSVDFTGWLDDFSHSGNLDALGGFARIGTHVNAFTIKNTLLAPIAPALRGTLTDLAVTGQNNRCPGTAERDPGDGSTPWGAPDPTCDPSQVPPGP